MNNFKKCCGILCAVLMLATAAAPSFAATEAKKDSTEKSAGNEIVERGWQQRCPKTKDKQTADKKQCEIFQRIDMKKNSLRLAEFAIGFPREKGMDSGAARGAIILPLGILLEQGAQMKIDDGKPLAFKIRFCTNTGCFSYLTFSKNVLNSMKKAKSVSFLFKTADGRKVNLVMGLGSFEKALQEIQ
ncbi:MAG: invasion associated locus B family protein [Alphaproteobacteria bacterium]|nr:invasion associated locus B family protein [Alphaproteobacteria bacterium]